MWRLVRPVSIYYAYFKAKWMPVGLIYNFRLGQAQVYHGIYAQEIRDRRHLWLETISIV